MKRSLTATLTLVWVVSLGCGQHEPAARPEIDAETEAAAEALAAIEAAADAEVDRQAAADRAEIREKAIGIFQSLPDVAASETNPVTPEKITLGKALYFDSRLSKNHDVSCNSCHGLTTYGVDNEPTSPGHKGQRGDRNSPTVYNAAFHVAQFWDGRADDVEAQAKGPVLNPIEMAMPSEAATVAVLESIPGYAPLFAAAFPDEKKPITYDNMARAIGAFERTLVTPSRFDAFLEGADDALSDEEIVGLDSFTIPAVAAATWARPSEEACTRSSAPCCRTKPKTQVAST